MKISHFLWLVLISLSLTVVACKDKKDEATTTPESTEGQMTTPEGIIPADPGAGSLATQTTTGSGGTEQHYKCTKPGCTGGGAAQGKCPVCGSDLVHNQAFHAQSAGAPGSTPDKAVPVTPQGGTGTTPPVTAPSAQNAKGEYHYKCAKGHPGAASAGNCGTCGEPLTHNQAYHAN